MSKELESDAVPAQGESAPRSAHEGPGTLVVAPVVLGLVTSLVTNAFAGLPPLAGLVLALVLGVVYWLLRRRATAPSSPASMPRRKGDETSTGSRPWPLLAALALLAVVLSLLAVVLAGAAVTLVLLVCVWLLLLLVAGTLAQTLSDTLQPLALQLVAVGVGAAVGAGAQPIIEEATESKRRTTDPVLLASGLNPSFATPEVATDDAGTVHVLWMTSVPGSSAFEVATRRRATGGDWSSQERLSEAQHAAGGLHVTRRPSAEACALWDGYTDVDVIGFGDSRLWERCFLASAWTPRREVGSPSELELGDIRSHMIGTYTPDGSLATILYHLGGVWYGSQKLTGEVNARDLVFVADGNGRLHAIWDEGHLVHRVSDDGGRTWTPPRPIGLSSEVAIDVAADAQGRVHLVTATGGDVLYTRWTDTGWEPETELSGPLAGTTYPGIGVGPDGRATVAWSIPTGLAVATQRGDGSFGPAELVRAALLGGDGQVQVTVDDDGFREVVVLLADGDLVHVELAPSDD